MMMDGTSGTNVSLAEATLLPFLQMAHRWRFPGALYSHAIVLSSSPSIYSVPSVVSHKNPVANQQPAAP